jgi:hypothetical protein
MGKAVPPLPQYAFMAWCSGGAQGQLYLYLCCARSFIVGLKSVNFVIGIPNKETELQLFLRRQEFLYRYVDVREEWKSDILKCFITFTVHQMFLG